MADILLILSTIGLFALAIVYSMACESLKAKKPHA